MRFSGKALMSFCSIVISGWVVITALNWPLMAALFPVVIGIPVSFMAIFTLYFILTGKENHDKEDSRLDFRLSEPTDQALANRRTISIFLWILGFFMLIVLVGFLVAIPFFFALFLKLVGKKGWKTSLGQAVLALGFFYGLFVWLLHTPLPEGWVQKALRTFGIG